MLALLTSFFINMLFFAILCWAFIVFTMLSLALFVCCRAKARISNICSVIDRSCSINLACSSDNILSLVVLTCSAAPVAVIGQTRPVFACVIRRHCMLLWHCVFPGWVVVSDISAGSMRILLPHFLLYMPVYATIGFSSLDIYRCLRSI